jgi:hypothetical protein
MQGREIMVGLPLRHRTGLIFVLSILTVILIAAVSIAALLYHPVIYPTSGLLQPLLPAGTLVPCLLRPGFWSYSTE